MHHSPRTDIENLLDTPELAPGNFIAFLIVGYGKKAASNMNFDHSIVKILKITCLYMEAVLS